MDTVKYDGKSRRQVRIFFVKPRPGYVLANGLSSATGVSYGLPHGNLNLAVCQRDGIIQYRKMM